MINSLQVSVFQIDYIFLSNLVLSSVILVLTLLNIALKRPYLALFFGCHQRIDRSFRLLKKPLPICSRCSGIYLGILINIAVNYLWNLPFYFYLIMGIPLVIDGILQKYKNISSNNVRRIISGLLFSFTLVYLFALYNALVVQVAKWIVSIV